MKYAIFKPCLGLLLAFTWLPVMAQQGVVSAGGEATATTGNVSFSVGQVFFTIQTGSEGTTVQGLQQPYEISVITGIDQAEGMQLLFAVYPNPVKDLLTLKIDGIALERAALLEIHLFDMDGKRIMSKKAEGMETGFSMTQMAAGIYFLHVIDTGGKIGDAVMKTFKIIKSQ